VLGDIAALQRENALQRAQLAELLSTNAKLVAEIAKLNDRVAELLAIAQRKQRKKTTSTAEKAPEPPPVVEANAQQAFEARPKPPLLPEKTKTAKGGARRTVTAQRHLG
jgi:regulator of replication initiation timing